MFRTDPKLLCSYHNPEPCHKPAVYLLWYEGSEWMYSYGCTQHAAADVAGGNVEAIRTVEDAILRVREQDIAQQAVAR